MGLSTCSVTVPGNRSPVTKNSSGLNLAFVAVLMGRHQFGNPRGQGGGIHLVPGGRVLHQLFHVTSPRGEAPPQTPSKIVTEADPRHKDIQIVLVMSLVGLESLLFEPV